MLTSPTIMPGHILPTSLPDFVVGACLGQGQMGAVYQAYQVSSDRDVAIKFLTHVSQLDRERFTREIEILGKVQHPNVVSFLGCGECEGVPYIVMELLTAVKAFDPEWAKGQSEDSLLDRFAELLEALEALHGLGIIHRDLKPENLGIPQDGRLRVLDFGLAKLLGQDHTLTQSGQILGSLAYMSPEQLRDSRSVDERSDLYAAGMILRELLSGGNPFEGMAWSEAVSAILSGRLPSGPKSVPARLTRYLQRLVDPRPAERFCSAREARQELFSIRQQVNVAAAPGPAASLQATPEIPPPRADDRARPGYFKWSWTLWTLALTWLFATLLGPLDWNLYDRWTAARAARAGPPPFKMAIIEVDDESIAKLGRMPWPRGQWATLVERLGSARCLLLDVLFVEPSDASQDLRLASAMRRTGNVILATSGQPLRPGSPYFQASEILKPIGALENSCRALGHISVARDRDGTLRTYLPYLSIGQNTVPSMAESAAGQLGLPSNRCAQIWVDFSRFSLDQVPRFSASRLLEAEPAEREAYLTGATVLLLPTYTGGVDIIATPLSAATPAGLVHLFAIGSSGLVILSGWPWAVALIGLMARGEARRPLVYVLKAAGAAVLTWLGTWLLFYQGIFLSPVTATLALLCGAGVTAANQWSHNLRARALYRKTLERFVGPVVLSKLHESPLLRALPQRTRVTVMWGELSALTDLAEEAEAEEVVAILQRCYLQIISALEERSGSPCEMLGDGFLAFWPEDQAQAAVGCALQLQQKIGGLIEEVHGQGFPRLSFSMGLASGPLIAGELGNERFSRYALVGRQVALAHQFALLAGRNGVLMCKRTYELTRQMDYQALAQLPLSLRGFKDRVMSWRLGERHLAPAPASEH